MKVFLSDLPNCEANAEDEGKAPGVLERDNRGYFSKEESKVSPPLQCETTMLFQCSFMILPFYEKKYHYFQKRKEKLAYRGLEGKPALIFLDYRALSKGWSWSQSLSFCVGRVQGWMPDVEDR